MSILAKAFRQNGSVSTGGRRDDNSQLSVHLSATDVVQNCFCSSLLLFLKVTLWIIGIHLTIDKITPDGSAVFTANEQSPLNDISF